MRGGARGRLVRACAGAALVFALSACQHRAGTSQSSAPPPAVPSGPKVAVVDLPRALRAHPRWPEVDAIDRRIAQLQAQLAAPPAAPFPMPQINLQPEIQAAAQQEVQQMRPQFQQQFNQTAAAERDAAQKELDAFVAQVKAAEQAQFNQQQQALQAQFAKAIQDKQRALDQDNGQFQQQTLEQYRLPLLNLALKRDTVAPGDRAQQRTIDTQIQTLTKERDDKIAAHEKANQQALQDFQQQQNQAYQQQLKDLEAQLNKDAQQQVAQKQAEVTSRVHTRLQAKQAELNAELNAKLKTDLAARQQTLVAGARTEIERARQQAVADLRTRDEALRAQLRDAQSERARLMEGIVADLRVETAALAQEKGYDLVLTQAQATVDVTDITDQLIARIKH